ncbi:hypothetical protein THAOC_30656 [Thalassiosira oceanica]|uniref:Solute-binding protein family 3/N-terminal domain-containing protein n=1 Tax=Thalassiosira oceanica TaxID=159749 RepID=K0R9T9_THAOC|nr:hypothetical protein THAOC_30656 [Thalassiosira oceanica]|eukprot:EJK50383.1 hypothetical protein THAOC_30656 [Thalassiosira oceanica]
MNGSREAFVEVRLSQYNALTTNAAIEIEGVRLLWPVAPADAGTVGVATATWIWTGSVSAVDAEDREIDIATYPGSSSSSSGSWFNGISNLGVNSMVAPRRGRGAAACIMSPPAGGSVDVSTASPRMARSCETIKKQYLQTRATRGAGKILPSEGWRKGWFARRPPPHGGGAVESRGNALSAAVTETAAAADADAVAAQAAKLRFATSAADDRAGSDDGSSDEEVMGPSDVASSFSSLSSLGPEPTSDTPPLHDRPEPLYLPPPPASSLGVGAHAIAGINATDPRTSAAADINRDPAGVTPPAAAAWATADATGAGDEGFREVHAYPVEDTPDLPVAQVEEMKPWLRRREGKLAVLAVGLLLAALAVILGVFLTMDPSEPVVEEKTSDAPTVSPTLDPRPLLTVVRERGSVRCGVEDTVATGAVQFGKFAADLCRSVAAAVLGDPNATQLVPVGKDRYQVLNDHGVDLLTGDAWTVEKAMREPTTGSTFNFGRTYYRASIVYVGVKNYVECAMSEKRYDDCGGLAICAFDSVDIRDLMTSLFPDSFLQFDAFPVIEAALHNGTCNVLVSDDYQIYGSELQADLNNGTYVMSDFRLSLNRISMVTRTGNAGDQEWSDVLSGLFAGMFRATQIGLGLDPAACRKTLEDPRRGSGPISFLDPVHCVGNHAEIFGRSISTKIFRTEGFAKAIDAPNLGSLQCRDCENVLLSSPTLREIVDRGGLRCGIYMDQERNYTKMSLPVLMAETYCTAVAATIFQGDPGAVNITHFTEIDFSVFPDDFDVVAGVTSNLVDLKMDGPPNFAYDPEEPSPWRSAAVYFFEDKYYLDGVEYNGIGKGHFMATRSSIDEDDGLARLTEMVFVATVHAQRIGIGRSAYQMMPLIELFGDAVTFMLKDVVALVGNYDEVLAESLRASDGQIEKGWNGVVQNFALTTRAPMLRCSLYGNCPPEVLGREVWTGDLHVGLERIPRRV